MDRLQQLYLELQPKLFMYFYVRTANKQIAEDLAQDVFYEASKTLHRYRGDASLSSWLYSIANNLLKKHYRSKKYEHALFEKLHQSEQFAESAEQQALHRAELLALHEAIHELDELSKELILLRIYSELSFKEIGDVIGKSENYARVQFHRLKLKLKGKEHT